jgi:DNA mismatch endonuclease (patch repair protein)
MDTVSTKKRSETMRAIKSRNTSLEKNFRKILRDAGYKFKNNVASLTGKPDIVFPKQKVAIFLDSCFWHGCKRHCRMPIANRVYWRKKIENNKKRDKKINAIYKKMGWEILRFWEHEIKKCPNKTINHIEKIIKK